MNLFYHFFIRIEVIDVQKIFPPLCVAVSPKFTCGARHWTLRDITPQCTKEHQEEHVDWGQSETEEYNIKLTWSFE